MAYYTMDSKHGFDCIKHIVQQHPYSITAWNCYYKVLPRYSFPYVYSILWRYFVNFYDLLSCPFLWGENCENFLGWERFKLYALVYFYIFMVKKIIDNMHILQYLYNFNQVLDLFWKFETDLTVI